MSPSQAVGLDVGAVQAALAADGIDGWLLYDFRGLNPLATDVTGVGRQGGHLASMSVEPRPVDPRRSFTAGEPRRTMRAAHNTISWCE